MMTQCASSEASCQTELEEVPLIIKLTVDIKDHHFIRQFLGEQAEFARCWIYIEYRVRIFVPYILSLARSNRSLLQPRQKRID